jgi:hypothetical protein
VDGYCPHAAGPEGRRHDIRVTLRDAEAQRARPTVLVPRIEGRGDSFLCDDGVFQGCWIEAAVAPRSGRKSTVAAAYVPERNEQVAFDA